MKQPLDTFLRKKPALGEGVYLAQGAVVLGDVTLGDRSSVWCNAVLRGDINRIVVGHHSVKKYAQVTAYYLEQGIHVGRPAGMPGPA